MNLCDAHSHYHFSALGPVRDAVLVEAQAAGLGAAVVNGTCEADWNAVADFVRGHSWALAAYGIHPWQAALRGASWEGDLQARLEADPRASVGEIGLDTWVQGHDLADQAALFSRQWAIAAEHRRPVTVHCVRAWEELRRVLGSMAHYEPGFLIHAYSGPQEWVPWFVEKGARFSYSAYFIHERKLSQREAFRWMPRERILIETDAPELSPPVGHNPYPLTDPVSGLPLNHPANLKTALRSLAEVLDSDVESISLLTMRNWEHLFGPVAEAVRPQ
jgi:TatD DNase family protein